MESLFDLEEYTIEVEPSEPVAADFNPAGGNLWTVDCSDPGALENMVQDDATWLGQRLVVETRYVDDLMERLYGEGWTVTIGGEDCYSTGD